MPRCGITAAFQRRNEPPCDAQTSATRCAADTRRGRRSAPVPTFSGAWMLGLGAQQGRRRWGPRPTSFGLSPPGLLPIIRAMKITTLLNSKLLCAALLVFGLNTVASAGEATAFSLIKEANEYVGKDARDKVVQLRSEKSINSLQPVIWYVVFYDPDATFKAAEVKFAAG